MGIVKLAGLDENRWGWGNFFTPKWEGLAVRVLAHFPPICDKHPKHMKTQNPENPIKHNNI
jgi:hypothetical protein